MWMRKFLVKLVEPLETEANNQAVHERLIKIVAHYGPYTKGLTWEYTPIFTQLFPYIADQLMGWSARRSRSTSPRLLLRLVSRERALAEVWKR